MHLVKLIFFYFHHLIFDYIYLLLIKILKKQLVNLFFLLFYYLEFLLIGHKIIYVLFQLNFKIMYLTKVRIPLIYYYLLIHLHLQVFDLKLLIL